MRKDDEGGPLARGKSVEVRFSSVTYRRVAVRPPFFLGNMKRHKLASLLPTWRRGLDRLYRKSLSTGSLQGLQRPHLHGVPDGTPSAGRPCWHGRYGLFSAKASR
jgi:hypothetical protein